MRTIGTAGMLLAIASAAFGQDPNRNRMNEQYPELRQQLTPAGAFVAAPPAHANRMNVQYPEAPAFLLAGGPSPFENRLNEEWAAPESSAQAEKPGKPKKR
jgi:hypothetical protein